MMGLQNLAKVEGASSPVKRNENLWQGLGLNR